MQKWAHRVNLDKSIEITDHLKPEMLHHREPLKTIVTSILHVGRPGGFNYSDRGTSYTIQGSCAQTYVAYLHQQTKCDTRFLQETRLLESLRACKRLAPKRLGRPWRIVSESVWKLWRGKCFPSNWLKSSDNYFIVDVFRTKIFTKI